MLFLYNPYAALSDNFLIYRLSRNTEHPHHARYLGWISDTRKFTAQNDSESGIEKRHESMELGVRGGVPGDRQWNEMVLLQRWKQTDLPGS